MARIGFVGLGHMGNPMVKNLLRHDHHVIVFDVVRDAVEGLVDAGAQPARTLSDVCKDTDIIFTMLQQGQQVRDVCISPQGLFAHAQPNTLFIDCSSIDVTTSRELTQFAIQRGFEMIDAPVSGGVVGAAAGTLTFMVGGDEQSFERAKPILEALGKRLVHAGAAGNGQVAKICNNLILGISMVAVSEAFCLAEKLGLSAEKLFEISSNASGQCWAMTSYCPIPGLVPQAPSNRDYMPGFSAAMMLKDLHLSQEAAQSVQAETSLGKVATHLYDIFVSKGNGEMDFSAIIKMIDTENQKD